MSGEPKWRSCPMDIDIYWILFVDMMILGDVKFLLTVHMAF